MKRCFIRLNDDSGSASILAVSLVGVLFIVASATAAAAHIRIEKAHATSAADLSALAGANQLHNGTLPPCDAAETVAQANDARLSRCVVEGENVVIWVDFVGILGGHVVSVAGPTAQ